MSSWGLGEALEMAHAIRQAKKRARELPADLSGDADLIARSDYWVQDANGQWVPDTARAALNAAIGKDDSAQSVVDAMGRLASVGGSYMTKGADGARRRVVGALYDPELGDHHPYVINTRSRKMPGGLLGALGIGGRDEVHPLTHGRSSRDDDMVMQFNAEQLNRAFLPAWNRALGRYGHLPSIRDRQSGLLDSRFNELMGQDPVNALEDEADMLGMDGADLTPMILEALQENPEEVRALLREPSAPQFPPLGGPVPSGGAPSPEWVARDMARHQVMQDASTPVEGLPAPGMLEEGLDPTHPDTVRGQVLDANQEMQDFIAAHPEARFDSMQEMRDLYDAWKQAGAEEESVLGRGQERNPWERIVEMYREANPEESPAGIAPEQTVEVDAVDPNTGDTGPVAAPRSPQDTMQLIGAGQMPGPVALKEAEPLARSLGGNLNNLMKVANDPMIHDLVWAIAYSPTAPDRYPTTQEAYDIAERLYARMGLNATGSGPYEIDPLTAYKAETERIKATSQQNQARIMAEQTATSRYNAMVGGAEAETRRRAQLLDERRFGLEAFRYAMEQEGGPEAERVVALQDRFLALTDDYLGERVTPKAYQGRLRHILNELDATMGDAPLEAQEQLYGLIADEYLRALALVEDGGFPNLVSMFQPKIPEEFRDPILDRLMVSRNGDVISVERPNSGGRTFDTRLSVAKLANSMSRKQMERYVERLRSTPGPDGAVSPEIGKRATAKAIVEELRRLGREF